MTTVDPTPPPISLVEGINTQHVYTMYTFTRILYNNKTRTFLITPLYNETVDMTDISRAKTETLQKVKLYGTKKLRLPTQ